ncbi:MAG: aminoglycoside phosphotransferase family protein [Betaproteobacteria bacterium]|nr:aminoglycoside phosphotransferase family protein [Betaproteobacteria bacterium]
MTTAHIDPRAGPFTENALGAYLRTLHGQAVANLRLSRIGAGADAEKAYGYGSILRIDYEVASEPRHVMLETVRAGPFGHEHMADRAQSLLWAHQAYGRLPRHVPSLDIGAIREDGSLLPVGSVTEFFMLVPFVDGTEYAADLLRIRENGALGESDAARARALCDYLIDIHALRGAESGLYVRRIRELLGHGEGIFGIVDGYPKHSTVTARELRDIESRCLDWRWKLKGRAHRLRQVHGDFHPWNILFRPGTDFTVLDRSRGEWGEPADDVACLTFNYLFFSLQRSGRLEGAFDTLFGNFWERYLGRSGDNEILDVVAPFFAFRGLVLASPLWYPTLPEPVRRKLLRFVRAVLDTDRFEPTRVNDYCGA